MALRLVPRFVVLVLVLHVVLVDDDGFRLLLLCCLEHPRPRKKRSLLKTYFDSLPVSQCLVVSL